MPDLPAFSVPKYRHYRPKNLGVVRLNGRDFYLGEFGSPASLEKYHRLLAEWLENGRRLPSTTAPVQQPEAPPLSINEMLLQYWQFAEGYYRSGDRPTKELTCMEHAIRPLRRLYGLTPAAEFGPKGAESRTPVNDRRSHLPQANQQPNQSYPPDLQVGRQRGANSTLNRRRPAHRLRSESRAHYRRASRIR